MRSPLAVCLLIRYMSKILHDDISATNARAAYQVSQPQNTQVSGYGRVAST